MINNNKHEVNNQESYQKRKNNHIKVSEFSRKIESLDRETYQLEREKGGGEDLIHRNCKDRKIDEWEEKKEREIVE